MSIKSQLKNTWNKLSRKFETHVVLNVLIANAFSFRKFSYFTFIVCWWQGWEHTTPKYGNLENWIFFAERIWETAGAGGSPWTGSRDPHVRGNLLIPGGKEHPYLWRPRGSEGHLNKQALLTFPQFTTINIYPFAPSRFFPQLSTLHQT